MFTYFAIELLHTVFRLNATILVVLKNDSGVREALCPWSCPLCNNNNLLYSSQREIKAVLRSDTFTHKEELNCTYLSNSKSWNTHTYTPFLSICIHYRNDLMLKPSKPKITWNNAFSDKPKHKNSQIKVNPGHQINMKM